MRRLLLAVPLVLACSSSDGSTSDAIESCSYDGSYDVTLTPEPGATCNAPADTDVWSMQEQGDGSVALYFAGAPNACPVNTVDGCKLNVACVADGTDAMGTPRRTTLNGSVAVVDGALSGSVRLTLRVGTDTCFVDYKITGSRK